MAWQKHDPRRFKRSQIILTAALAVVLVLVAIASFSFVRQNDQKVPVSESSDSRAQTVTVPPGTQEKPLSYFDKRRLQAAVDDWVVARPSMTASVVITDADGNILASSNPDEVYFAASLYKLYVAYEGYRQLDGGETAPDEPYLNGRSRDECLDLMIRSSDSPCAEKLWNEIGKMELTDSLRELGITNTSMVSLSTTARDIATILAKIDRGEGLSDASKAAYLDSMKTQEPLYRRGLPSGFTSSLTVYNKVGWNELVEWHDAAIVETEGGHRLVVAVLTKNAGSSGVAGLAKALEPVIVQ